MISCRSRTLQLLEESKRQQGPLSKLESAAGVVRTGLVGEKLDEPTQ
jgi:hypothetical protein